ncbi:uncharacterized protein LOC117301344 [Asterias rubens]|uniref:uncharacterized protein LOC117301344 n=1 Tax=Asterias rubens TaxID=7604 RepID=UPI001455A7ED|nr:uncharacterized protein LOC117301344 [Asterias rubens]
MFDTKKILSETPQGRIVIQDIEKSGFLTKKVKHHLVKILVGHLISSHGKNPGAFEKNALAQSVITAFPCLRDPQGITGYESFYTKGSHRCPATGYLEEHLRYVRKHMLETTKKDPQGCTTTTPQAVFESDKLPEVPEDTQSKIEWMKNNLEPAGQVKDYMSTTVTYRRDWLKNKDRTVAAILQEFPRLLDKNMIEQDYQLQYPTSAENMHSRWDAMVEPLIELWNKDMSIMERGIGTTT